MARAKSKGVTFEALIGDREIGPAFRVDRNEHGEIVGGRINDHTPDKRILRRFVAMTEPQRVAEREVGQEMQSRQPAEIVRSEAGVDLMPAVAIERRVKKQKVAARNGQAGPILNAVIRRGAGTGLTRYYLACDHFIERATRPHVAECPWGCGPQVVEA